MLKCAKIVIVLFYLGCSDEHNNKCLGIDSVDISRNIWIDSTCETDVLMASVDAVDLLNDFGKKYVCSDLINIVGLIDVINHDSWMTKINVPVITCHYDEIYVPELIHGYATNFSIDLYLWLINRYGYKYFRRLILHEMMHFIGVWDHAESIDSVMNPDLKTTDCKFTDEDVDLFCKYFDCI